MEIPGVPPQLLQALTEAAGQGQGRSQRLALVGGAVRDLLLHRVHRDPWRGLLDLDLVVSDGSPELGQQAADSAGDGPVPGDSAPPAAHRLALALQAQDPAALGYCHFHHAYGTVELELHGVLLDLATARCETYPEPGENPVVRPGVLEDDLARRDFSVNGMALVLEAAAASCLIPMAAWPTWRAAACAFSMGAASPMTQPAW